MNTASAACTKGRHRQHRGLSTLDHIQRLITFEADCHCHKAEGAAMCTVKLHTSKQLWRGHFSIVRLNSSQASVIPLSTGNMKCGRELVRNSQHAWLPLKLAVQSSVDVRLEIGDEGMPLHQHCHARLSVCSHVSMTLNSRLLTRLRSSC